MKGESAYTGAKAQLPLGGLSFLHATLTAPDSSLGAASANLRHLLSCARLSASALAQLAQIAATVTPDSLSTSAWLAQPAYHSSSRHPLLRLPAMLPAPASPEPPQA